MLLKLSRSSQLEILLQKTHRSCMVAPFILGYDKELTRRVFYIGSSLFYFNLSIIFTTTIGNRPINDCSRSSCKGACTNE